ncbi:DNA adenine methylase, partial [thiotrophic endosymbiont of Bathymodiolus puteoserpentis (Logatchev)]|uniref:DNA adenine methylase n=1 Tax=thiotrophic endosymbiont of Bathymodiolus puteoserpentis (Logatchev) TaxID=343240 RepID=UPI0010B0C3CC
GQIMGIALLDFVIIAKNGHNSFYQELKHNKTIGYVGDGFQMGLFDLLEVETPNYQNNIHKINKYYYQQDKSKIGYFQLQNRRYLGNKYKLLGFIEDIVSQKCDKVKSFCDIFAGTGVVGDRFNNKDISIISNDFLSANNACLQTFLNTKKDLYIEEKINYLNSISPSENYFSEHFGNRYFFMENARKIGVIREEIDNIASNQQEKNNLICSLLYAVDKVANTVGHYDAFRKKMDSTKPVNLLIPNIDYSHNVNNKVYQEDANQLIKKISCDVLYIDPPYNSRQYSDAYHLLENLVEWKKPAVVGIGKKMDRNHIKSNYCLKNATMAFSNLINHANCKHILFSYNNTQDSKNERSNARISDNDILHILSNKGKVDVFERDYKTFTTGKSNLNGNIERVFYCEVKG